jgi:colanic acid/amylovoran biosynthesis glycosyltransferase
MNRKANWRKLKYRAAAALHGITRAATWKALNVARYGEEARNLILAAICGGNPRAFEADVFIAHFGPAGVTAAKLRELGMIRGKIATVFHGVDVSHRDVLPAIPLNISSCFNAVI